MVTNYKNIVIDVSLNEECAEQLATLKGSPIFEKAEKIFLIHVFNEKDAIHLPGNLKISENYDEIKNHVCRIMTDLKEKLFDKDDSRIELRNFFDSNVKIKAKEFLKDTGAELVIAATMGEHDVDDLWKDSFSCWLVSTSPCDVYIVRPKK